MVGLTVDVLSSWHEILLDLVVRIIKEPQEHDLAPVRSFFFEDPGGTTLEIQQFMKPEHQQIFNNP